MLNRYYLTNPEEIFGYAKIYTRAWGYVEEPLLLKSVYAGDLDMEQFKSSEFIYSVHIHWAILYAWHCSVNRWWEHSGELDKKTSLRLHSSICEGYNGCVQNMREDRDETSDFAWGGAKNEHSFLEETV